MKHKHHQLLNIYLKQRQEKNRIKLYLYDYICT
jgi:hypothetical protein